MSEINNILITGIKKIMLGKISNNHYSLNLIVKSGMTVELELGECELDAINHIISEALFDTEQFKASYIDLDNFVRIK